MADEKCPKCGGYLYRGWHTNCPGEALGKVADDVICTMTGPLREQLAAAERERDAWRSLMKATIDEAMKATGDVGLCLGNECGGCDTDDSVPCDEIAQWAAHAWGNKEANAAYDLQQKLTEALAAQQRAEANVAVMREHWITLVTMAQFPRLTPLRGLEPQRHEEFLKVVREIQHSPNPGSALLAEHERWRGMLRDMANAWRAEQDDNAEFYKMPESVAARIAAAFPADGSPAQPSEAEKIVRELAEAEGAYKKHGSAGAWEKVVSSCCERALALFPKAGGEEKKA
jgi:hypothetical protein